MRVWTRNVLVGLCCLLIVLCLIGMAYSDTNSYSWVRQQSNVTIIYNISFNGTYEGTFVCLQNGTWCPPMGSGGNVTWGDANNTYWKLDGSNYPTQSWNMMGQMLGNATRINATNLTATEITITNGGYFKGSTNYLLFQALPKTTSPSSGRDFYIRASDATNDGSTPAVGGNLYMYPGKGVNGASDGSIFVYGYTGFIQNIGVTKNVSALYYKGSGSTLSDVCLTNGSGCQVQNSTLPVTNSSFNGTWVLTEGDIRWQYANSTSGGNSSFNYTSVQEQSDERYHYKNYTGTGTSIQPYTWTDDTTYSYLNSSVPQKVKLNDNLNMTGKNITNAQYINGIDFTNITYDATTNTVYWEIKV